MPRIVLTLIGVATADELNAVTAALMMVDGVENVDVGREWAEVEGTADRESLVEALAPLAPGIEVR